MHMNTCVLFFFWHVVPFFLKSHEYFWVNLKKNLQIIHTQIISNNQYNIWLLVGRKRMPSGCQQQTPQKQRRHRSSVNSRTRTQLSTEKSLFRCSTCHSHVQIWHLKSFCPMDIANLVRPNILILRGWHRIVNPRCVVLWTVCVVSYHLRHSNLASVHHTPASVESNLLWITHMYVPICLINLLIVETLQ